MHRYYVDTAIYRDFLEDRRDGWKPLGEFAHRFFIDCQKHGAKLPFSDIVLFELAQVPSSLVDSLFQTLRWGMIKVEINKMQDQEARRLSSVRTVPVNDARHAVLARDFEAVMIARDDHYNSLQDIVDCQAPEEVTF